MVMSVLLYGAETWPVTQHDIRRLKTFQMRCLRDILGLTLWDMHRNVDILKETGELPVEEHPSSSMQISDKVLALYYERQHSNKATKLPAAQIH